VAATVAQEEEEREIKKERSEKRMLGNEVCVCVVWCMRYECAFRMCPPAGMCTLDDQGMHTQGRVCKYTHTYIHTYITMVTRLFFPGPHTVSEQQCHSQERVHTHMHTSNADNSFFPGPHALFGRLCHPQRRIHTQPPHIRHSRHRPFRPLGMFLVYIASVCVHICVFVFLCMSLSMHPQHLSSISSNRLCPCVGALCRRHCLTCEATKAWLRMDIIVPSTKR
jgi:hypothetical protein